MAERGQIIGLTSISFYLYIFLNPRHLSITYPNNPFSVCDQGKVQIVCTLRDLGERRLFSSLMNQVLWVVNDLQWPILEICA